MALGIEQNVLDSFNNIYQYTSLYISQLKKQRTYYIFLKSYVGRIIGNILIYRKTIIFNFLYLSSLSSFQKTLALLFDCFLQCSHEIRNVFLGMQKTHPRAHRGKTKYISAVFANMQHLRRQRGYIFSRENFTWELWVQKMGK